MSINLNTDGILSNKTDMSGNNCQVKTRIEIECFIIYFGNYSLIP